MSEPIRILHVLTAMNMAGTETLLMNFYRNIDRSKVQFDFAVSTKQHCAYDDEINSLGGRIIHYPLYRPNIHFKYVKWWNQFFDSHQEYKIVHGHIGSTAAIYLNIAKKHGCFTIAHSHSIKGNKSLKDLAYDLYSYPTRFIADQFFGCSKQALIDRYGRKVAESNKAKVINNGIDAGKYIFSPDIRKRVRGELRIDGHQLIIGTVGRLTPQKNPHEIIRICEELKKKGLEFVFLWFGAGELENDIRKKIGEKQLDDSIKLMGTRPDIYNVLQAFDIFLFPSLWEGLGISCVEAQASGLPTLCSNTIPYEAKVTDCCKFLPLNDTNVWCDEVFRIAHILHSDNYKRPNMYMKIVEAGYDIKDVTKWLQHFYMKQFKKREGNILNE